MCNDIYLIGTLIGKRTLSAHLRVDFFMLFPRCRRKDIRKLIDTVSSSIHLIGWNSNNFISVIESINLLFRIHHVWSLSVLKCYYATLVSK